MTKKEILMAVCGVDDDSEAKAQIMIETKFIDVEKGEELRVDSIQLYGPILHCFRNLHRMNVDIQFENASDSDFLQCTQMLKEFCIPENSMDNSDSLIPIVQVTILPLSFEGEYFISGVHASWTIIPSQENKLPDTIRFIFNNNDFHTYHIREDMLETEEVEAEEQEPNEKEND